MRSAGDSTSLDVTLFRSAESFSLRPGGARLRSRVRSHQFRVAQIAIIRSDLSESSSRQAGENEGATGAGLMESNHRLRPGQALLCR
jgi:hypothetical protein